MSAPDTLNITERISADALDAYASRFWRDEAEREREALARWEREREALRALGYTVTP